MESNFVKDCFDCAKNIEDEVYHLRELAKSFYLTGNEIVSSRLHTFADGLAIQSDKIREICSNKTSKDLEEIHELNGNMIKGMLAGAEKV